MPRACCGARYPAQAHTSMSWGVKTRRRFRDLLAESPRAATGPARRLPQKVTSGHSILAIVVWPLTDGWK